MNGMATDGGHMQTRAGDLVLDGAGCFDPNEAFEFTSRYLVAGLTTPGRRRPELDGHPFFVSRGEGAYLWSLNGTKYIDLNCGHGAALVGHSHPAIKAALHAAIEDGLLCGQETVYPGRVAKRITEMVPSAELVRLMFTGTEATALAVRVARAYTSKLKVVKFEGHYHGMNDALQYNLWPALDQAGPRHAPIIRGESAGLIPENSHYIAVLPWNDLTLLEDLLRRESDQIAGVIMEPINYNSGVLLPRPGYLGVTPDLTTLGKALGGGLPIAALVGRRDVMEALAPVGKVSNQGTYYGQTMVMRAANAAPSLSVLLRAILSNGHLRQRRPIDYLRGHYRRHGHQTTDAGLAREPEGVYE
jgi:glutamate-1-semialdehyde 2,1-aminomutase